MDKEAEKLEISEEKKYLKETIEIIHNLINEYEQKIHNLYKNFDSNSNDPYLVEELTRNFSKTLKDLLKSLDTPYFARIDFSEKGTQEPEHDSKIYIGKCSVIKDDSKIQVVDWRTPIAGLYYDGRLGEVSYECPKGTIEGVLSLKRIYEIEKGNMLCYSDIDVTANDELLKPYLSVSSDSRLKNIIATIQSEQNKIIRAKMTKPIIVQGVAGSGKTTVALHRIAYLTYDKDLKTKNFLIIAPNKFFLDYISAVLPDLGVDDVSQLTFEDFAKEVIGNGIKIEKSNDKLEKIVNNPGDENDVIQRAAKLKSSLEYKKALDEYLEKSNFGFLPNQDLKVGDIIILSKEKLFESFNSQYHLPGASMKELFNLFIRRLGTFIEINEDKIEESIKKIRALEIEQIDSSLSEEEKKRKKIKIFDKYDDMLKKIENRGKKLLAEYSKKAGKKSALEIYKEFISQLDSSKMPSASEDVIIQIKEKILRKTNNKEVEFEDLAPLMYIQHQINGSEFSRKATHIVIDEAQDYSEFQFLVLKEILNNESMTILGDIAQGIYSYRGISDWNEVNKNVFNGKAEVFDLRKSYRTTMEIMETGNDVIDKIKEKIKVKLGEPVIRKGEPVVIEKKEENDLSSSISNRLLELQSNDRRNIAIITKTLEEAMSLYKKLSKKNILVNLISDKAIEYKGGISIMPSYLSKGLEFDSVIISDASQEKYGENELDAKLLYIAITRAMHTLDIYYTREKSKLLEGRKKEAKDNENIIQL